MKLLFAAALLIFTSFQASALTTEELKKQLDILAEEFQNLKTGGNNNEYNPNIRNRIRANRMAMGGYGEFVYTDGSSDLEDGTTNSKSDPVWDAQRFVLYLGYDFSPKWELFTEIEIEHANEIFLEQAFLSYKHSDALQFNVGVLLVPIGITNLYHEPTTFLATQRSTVEKKIIPTTWRENGISLTGQYKNLRYQAAILNSLIAKDSDGARFDEGGVRSGRQKASKADAGGMSFAGQMDYLLEGLGYVGASFYHGGVSGVDSDVDQRVWDLHANLSYKGFQMRALYADLSLSNIEDLNAELGLSGTGVAEQMAGYFVELGYNVFKGRSEASEVIPFVRYEVVDTQKTVASGFTKDDSKSLNNITIGVNYKPMASLVFKADYTIGENDAKTGYNSWNFGAGWNF